MFQTKRRRPLKHFFQRFRSSSTLRADLRVIVTIALDGLKAGVPAPVILDVDAFTAANFKPLDGTIWGPLEKLRKLKNRSFFGTITEVAAELYE